MITGQIASFVMRYCRLVTERSVDQEALHTAGFGDLLSHAVSAECLLIEICDPFLAIKFNLDTFLDFLLFPPDLGTTAPDIETLEALLAA